MSRYEELTDEDKILQAINFVAVGQPLPDALVEFLIQNDLHDCITKPQRTKDAAL